MRLLENAVLDKDSVAILARGMRKIHADFDVVDGFFEDAIAYTDG